MKSYREVPVNVASDIAREYDKSIVIVLAWDPVFNMVHTTTFGVSEADKLHAAHGGRIATKALGCDLTQTVEFSDYRDKIIAELQARLIERGDPQEQTPDTRTPRPKGRPRW